MTLKFFPIKTETACRLKWSWSTVYLTHGATGSCHRASISPLTTDNFDNFHNLPSKVLAREFMLAGQWPGDGCEYCRDVEAAGGYSDRLFQATIPEIYPTELDFDKTLTNIAPVILEVFFKNTCNLACLYCTEKSSSRIQAENLKFGKISSSGSERRDVMQKNYYDDLIAPFWNWMEKNYHKLKRLQVLGGEPFVQADLLTLIDFIDTHPNPNLEINIVSNLIINEGRFSEVIGKLILMQERKRIKNVQILASVESVGPAQDYVRFGFKQQTFDTNMEFLLTSQVRVGLLSTINALSIIEMPTLVEKFNSWNRIRHLEWYLHKVLPVQTHVMSPMHFKYSVWDNAIESTLSALPESHLMTKNMLQGLATELKLSTGNKIAQQKLIEYLDEIDRRRDTNWEKVFPWLTEYR